MSEHPILKILLVDDDMFLLNMYSLKFSKNDFEVTVAQSAQEAIKKFKDGYAPDIILLDIIMPGMDGIELLGEIRTNNYAPNAVVIMLTNQSENRDIEKAKELGIAGYIVKATTIPSEVITEVLDIYNKVHK